LTTHYLEEAEQLADRVAVIASDRIQAIQRTESTAQPTQLIQRLAERHGGEVPGLTVTRPSLEDVYLDMIGGNRDGS
jgi:ABC-2 type transport system ATP-binding protein